MTCPNCGLTITGTASYCPKCLTKIPKNSQTKSSGQAASKSKSSSASSGTSPKSNGSRGAGQQTSNGSELITCPNPQCGLTFPGPATFCPKCLTKIPKKKATTQVSAPSPSIKPDVESAPHVVAPQPVPPPPITLPPVTPPQPVKLVLWNNSLTTTQNLRRQIKGICERFNDIAQRSSKTEGDFSSLRNEVETKYANRIAQIEEDRKQTISAAKAEAEAKTKTEANIKTRVITDAEDKARRETEAETAKRNNANAGSKLKAEAEARARAEKETEGKIKARAEEAAKAKFKGIKSKIAADAVADNVKMKDDLLDSMKRLYAIEQSIPADLKSACQSTKSSPPIKPDFQLLTKLQKQVVTSVGCFTGFVLGFLLPVIGWIILGVKSSSRKKACFELMDNIQSGKVYLNAHLAECEAEINRKKQKYDQNYFGENYRDAIAEAERECANTIAEAERNYTNAISEIERTCANIVTEIEKNNANAMAEAERVYTKAIAEIERNRSNVISEAERNYTNIIAEVERICTNIVAEAERNYKVTKKQVDARYSSDLQLIEQNKNNRIASLETELESFYNDPGFKDFESRFKSLLEGLGATETAWKGNFSPLSDYPQEILLGMIESSMTISKSGISTLKTYKPVSFLMNTKIMLPFTEIMNSPIQLIIDYEEDMKKETMFGVQSFIMKLLKYMPLFSFSITYIDPIERGSNLGKLLKLSEVVSFDLCRKVYASQEDIQKRLKELEGFVDKTSTTLAGTDSVYRYNEQSDTPIVYHFIIINDYPKNFERSARESLEVLINNAKKCGISIIFTTNGDRDNLPPDAASISGTIKVSKNGTTIAYDGASHPFQFDKLTSNCEDFLEKCKNAYNKPPVPDFDTYFPASKYESPQFEDSTDKLLIPFAADSRRKLVELELGSPLTAHALLSGTTGSGKSTTLHMLITSIIMKYHPDDVQLWLVDYKKVEFAEYIENTPPHVKLVGLERSKEFTLSLLDMINTEFQNRVDLFKKAGVSNIADYRRKVGKMPRVILIIDEFHEMTQTIQGEPSYITILENILSEYRAFGLSCVFSDQAVSVGLRGLTDKGKMQIRTRLAMSNDVQEMRDTLALDSSFYNEELKGKMLGMGVGDVIFKRMYENEIGEAQPVFDRYKTVYPEKNKRVKVIESIIKNTDMPEERPLIVDGQHRSSFDQKIIDDFERDNSSIGKQIPLYIGTPKSLNPCFCFFLREKTNSNIMIIGADDDLRAAVVYWSIFSFIRHDDYKVYIFADNHDEMFTQYKDKFLSLKGEKCSVTTDLDEMCSVISDLQGNLKSNDVRTMVVWLGLDTLAEEFIDLPEKLDAGERKTAPAASSVRSPSSAAADDLEASLDAMLQEAFGSSSIDEILQADSSSKAAGPKEDSSAGVSNKAGSSNQAAYNAASDIQEIIEKGSRRGVFTLVTYSSYMHLKDTRFVKLEHFDHKIAFDMTMDESSNYLGRSSHASGLDTITAVYYDGTSTKTFRPYLI